MVEESLMGDGKSAAATSRAGLIPSQYGPDAAAANDIESWQLYRTEPHDYRDIRAIGLATSANRITIADGAGLEIGHYRLPDGPLTLTDERTRAQAIEALRVEGVDASPDEGLESLSDFPDATVSIGRALVVDAASDHVWSILLVRDCVEFNALPVAGTYDPASGVLSVYARPHAAPLETLLRRHCVRPRSVECVTPPRSVMERNVWAARRVAVGLGPFRSADSFPFHDIVEDERARPISCNLTTNAITRVPVVHRAWLNARVVREPLRKMKADYMLDIQRRILSTLVGNDDMSDEIVPCRLCGTESHSSRTGLAYCLWCCVLAQHGMLQDIGVDGPWTDATIWAIRRLAELEFGDSIGRRWLGRVWVKDPGLADEVVLARFLIPRRSGMITRPSRKLRRWDDWLRLAGLQPDTARTSRGTLARAMDGHPCRSLFERSIDDFLFLNGIGHDLEPHYPRHHVLNTRGLRADWRLRDGTYVEALGMLDEEHYAAKVRRKIELANAVGIPLVTIRPADLRRLPEIFAAWITPGESGAKVATLGLDPG